MLSTTEYLPRQSTTHLAWLFRLDVNREMFKGLLAASFTANSLSPKLFSGLPLIIVASSPSMMRIVDEEKEFHELA